MAISIANPETLSLKQSSSVLQALENPKYVWRTVNGIVRDANLPKDIVTNILARLPSDVLVTTGSRKGRLYSTRRHYMKRQSTLSKILSVLSDSPK